MTTQESAQHQEPSLFCAFFGGPRDGFKTGDLPITLAGSKLTGMEIRIPLGQPAQFSLFARYVCTTETQIEGFWHFEYISLIGPDGEQIVAKRPETQPRSEAVLGAGGGTHSE